MTNNLYLAVLLLPSFASSQELHTFSNGEVADAEKINENFQYVLKNASGSSCSAEQDGSSVVISCSDGTSGVLASAGTVVSFVTPAGGHGTIETTINTGDIVVKDGAESILGRFGAVIDSDENGPLIISTSVEVENLGRTSVHFINSRENQQVSWSPTFSEYTLSFQSDDCSGDPISTGNPQTMIKYRDGYIIFGAKVRTDPFLLQSYIWTDKPDDCLLNTYKSDGYYPFYDFIPSEYWSQAVYPVSVEQLP